MSGQSPFDLNSQPKRSAEQEAALKLKRDEAHNDLMFVLSKPGGRRFLFGLLAEAGIYQSSLRDGADMVQFHEGRRDTGLRLLAKIQKASPEKYLTMLKESQRANA